MGDLVQAEVPAQLGEVGEHLGEAAVSTRVQERQALPRAFAAGTAGIRQRAGPPANYSDASISSGDRDIRAQREFATRVRARRIWGEPATRAFVTSDSTGTELTDSSSAKAHRFPFR